MHGKFNPLPITAAFLFCQAYTSTETGRVSWHSRLKPICRHYNENVLLLSRLQPTCFILAETLYWLCSRCNLQTGYLHTSRPTCFPVSDRTYRHNRRQRPFTITRSLLANTWQKVSKGGDILCSQRATIYSFLVVFVSLHRARRTTKEQGGKQELTMPESRVRKRLEIIGLKASNTGRIFCDDS